jgi:hypothetical protein|tara:strand:+ start:3343 stop:3714 length:372 start_codon:yes stop_codon:yes gene_type:complete
MKIRIGISGSKEYTNKTGMKEYFFKLKELFGDNLEIVTRGKVHGAEKLAKKMSNLFDIEYKEVKPLYKTIKKIKYSNKVEFKNSKDFSNKLDTLVIFGEDLSEALKASINYLKEENKKVIFRK